MEDSPIMTNMSKKKKWIIGCSVVVFLILAVLAVETARHYCACPKLKFPSHVKLEDFQSPNDKISGDVTKAFEKTLLSQLADDAIIRPMLDDSQTIMYCYSFEKEHTAFSL